MPDGFPFDIPSHRQSQIRLHTRHLVEKHASGFLEGRLSVEGRERRERLGLSGEFVVATLLGQKFEFRDLPNGDRGVDLWNHGTSIDVKTSSARGDGTPVLAEPGKYRAKVIVFVRQSKRDRWGRFNILGWLFADEMKRMAAGHDKVEMCLCQLRPAHLGLPPNGYAEIRDPDLEKACERCGRPLRF